MTRAKLNDFLLAKESLYLLSYFIRKTDHDRISKAFTELSPDLDCEFFVFLPHIKEGTTSDHVFVCCNWTNVLEFAKLDEDIFQDPVSSHFEKLRDALQPDEPVAKYLVQNIEMAWEEYVNPPV